jgi:hypothetical protein
MHSLQPRARLHPFTSALAGPKHTAGVCTQQHSHVLTSKPRAMYESFLQTLMGSQPMGAASDPFMMKEPHACAS